MHTLRKYIKVVSAFLLINFLFSTFLPTISYALTAGPTAPEATSFEPIDTTDMVNLQTGDFTYNIPLLEVPGPSGGYPLSLSYHAGIMPGEEASWVGLGWTLNPGAINRTVNGFADDHRDVTSTNRFFWSGGERTSGEIGFTYGISGTCGVTAGISVGHDTYQGFGVGGFTGVAFGIGGTPLNANARVGVDPWGNPYGSVGLGAGTGESGTEGLKLSGSVGVSTNFKSVSAYSGVGVSYDHGTNNDTREKNGSTNLTGASISTSSGGASSLSIAGASSTGNSKSGNISTSGFNVVLPIPFLHLGFRSQRYWIDETENTSTFGSLHYPTASPSDWHYYDDKAFDTYTLLDPDEDGGIIENPNPEKVMGGSFPNYDHYTINAQGISGNIQPYIFQGYLHRQNAKEGDIYNTIHYSSGAHSNQLGFRFVGEFSNRYLYEPPNFESGSDLLNFNFASTTPETTGDGEIDGMKNGKLAGAKNIEYLTNREIRDKSSRLNEVGFMDTHSSGFSRLPYGQSNNDQIGAYVVTNESGVKYHFSLPVYASEEYQYSENTDMGQKFNDIKKPEKYAYTWLLTGITGPDFVDRGVIGEFDEEDWGYWVEFDYGKWTEDYVWRNPDLGTHKDLDTNFENFATGIKEVYYLDQIKTKTHTAIFVKDIRDDAKSAIRHFKNKFGVPTTDDEKEGSYIPKNISTVVSFEAFEGFISENTLSLPVSSLKLKDIYLFKNDALASFDKSAGDQFHQQMIYDRKLVCDGCSGDRVVDQHLPDNVVDVSDLTPSFVDGAIRVISMSNTTDPEQGALCPETINSFDTNLVPSLETTNYPKQGKLTLQAISFKGKAGAEYIPPLSFGYELDDVVFEEQEAINGVGLGNLYFFISEPNKALFESLNEGDLIKFRQGESWHYAYVSNKILLDTPLFTEGTLLFKNIGAKVPENGYIGSIRKTKNPPYDARKYDMWGYYKYDYENTEQSNLDRLVFSNSAKNSDVYSLLKITSSLGAEINITYEADLYNIVGLETARPFIINNLTGFGAEDDIEGEIYVDMDRVNDELEDVFDVGDHISMSYAILLYSDCGSIDFTGTTTCYIKEVKTDHLVIISNKLAEDLADITIGNPCNFQRYFGGGNLAVLSNKSGIYGGGIRCSSLEVKNRDTKTVSKTNYLYKDGCTSYEPFVMDFSKVINTSEHLDDAVFSILEEPLKDISIKNFSDLLANSRIITPPGVIYRNVTVQETYTDNKGNESYLPTYTTYEFQTFEDYMVDIYPQFLGEEEVTPSWSFSDVTTVANKIRKKKVTISDLTAQVGALKSITRYENVHKDNDRTNDRMIARTINHYLYDEFKSLFDDIELIDGDRKGDPLDPYKLLADEMESKYNSQGMVHESYMDARYVRQEDETIHFEADGGWDVAVSPYHLLGVISKKERFPLVHTGQTNINYKTGITTSTANLGFDFYSGAVTKTTHTDSHGNTFLSETIPAYRKYDGMGLSIHGGYNMLTQEASNHTYKVVDDASLQKESIISATIQTWNNDLNNLYKNSYNSSIGKRYDINTSEYVTLMIGNNSWFDEGQLVAFKAGGEEYQVRLGTWNSTLSGFTIENMEELDLDLSSDVSGLAAYWRSDTWRKHKAYTYTGNLQNQKTDLDGLVVYDPESFDDFDNWYASAGEPEAVWQKNSEITLYDRYSHALEATDVNGNFAATKMDSKHEKVLATVANASYTEFAYSGAEDEVVDSYFGGTVSQGEATIYTASDDEDAHVHTGDASLSVATGGKAFSFSATPTQSRNMKVSVWSSQSDGLIKYKVNDGAEQTLSPKVRQAGSWYLLSAYIPAMNTGDELEIWCEAGGAATYFDDFRVHPIDAPMTAYVYNEYDELTFILDNNNLFTEYKYDEMGRLKEVHRESFKYGVKKTSETTINYAGSY